MRVGVIGDTNVEAYRDRLGQIISVEVVEESFETLVCASLIPPDALLDAARGVSAVLLQPFCNMTANGLPDWVEALTDSGVSVRVALPLRFLPAVTKAREALAQGMIGDVFAAKITYRQSDLLDSVEADLKLTALPHLLDLLEWLLDVECLELFVEQSRDKQDRVAAAVLSMQLSGGAYATADVTRAATPDLEMTIYGSSGTLDIDGFHQKVDMQGSQSTNVYWGTDPVLAMLRGYLSAERAIDLPSPEHTLHLCELLSRM